MAGTGGQRVMLVVCALSSSFGSDFVEFGNQCSGEKDAAAVLTGMRGVRRGAGCSWRDPWYWYGVGEEGLLRDVVAVTVERVERPALYLLAI